MPESVTEILPTMPGDENEPPGTIGETADIISEIAKLMLQTRL